MKDVYEAFSSRSNHALAEALLELQRQLISKVQTLGPAAVALQMRDERPLTQILNSIESKASASDKPAVFVAFLAGFISAYIDYLALIVDRRAVESADAKLSADRDEHDQVDLIQMMILKAAFAHAGARAKELVSVVARTANVSESSVKFHLKRLARMGLVERLELGPKAVSYRISPLGEAVLARRSKPCELALFLIDEAASDATLRIAMRKEIEIRWPGKRNEEALAPAVSPSFPDTARVTVSSTGERDLSAIYILYQRKRGPLKSRSTIVARASRASRSRPFGRSRGFGRRTGHSRKS